MESITKIVIFLIVLSLQGCASKIYMDGEPYKDKSSHISYGKSCQLNYGIGVFREVSDEGQKLTWAEYVNHKDLLSLDPAKDLFVAFDGYINNYKNQKISFFIIYDIVAVGKHYTDEVKLFDTSLPTRKFLFKCPMIKGANISCTLRLKSDKLFDLDLPEIKYRVIGEFDVKLNDQQINKMIKEVNGQDK